MAIDVALRRMVRPKVYPRVEVRTSPSPYFCDDFLAQGDGMIVE